MEGRDQDCLPRAAPEHGVAAVRAAVSVPWALPAVNSELALGRGAWEREAVIESHMAF